MKTRKSSKCHHVWCTGQISTSFIKLGLDKENIPHADTNRLAKDLAKDACLDLNAVKQLRQYIRYHDGSLQQIISDELSIQFRKNENQNDFRITG